MAEKTEKPATPPEAPPEAPEVPDPGPDAAPEKVQPRRYRGKVEAGPRAKSDLYVSINPSTGAAVDVYAEEPVGPGRCLARRGQPVSRAVAAQVAALQG